MATPRFNTTDREGTRLRTLNSNFANLFELPTVPNTAYQLDVRVTGVTTLASTATPSAYAYWRRALYVTNSAGVVSNIGGIQTPAADLESDAAASLVIEIIGTSVIGRVSGSGGPINWIANAYIGVTDIVNEA